MAAHYGGSVLARRVIGALSRPVDAAVARAAGAGGRGAALPPGGRSVAVAGRPAARHVRAPARPARRGRPRRSTSTRRRTLLTARVRTRRRCAEGRALLRRWHRRLARRRAAGPRRAGSAGDVLRRHRLRRRRIAVPRRRPAGQLGRPGGDGGDGVRHDRLPHAHPPGARRRLGGRRRRRDRPLRRA